MGELTEVMRHKGDLVFIKLLNKVRAGDVDCKDENLLKSKFIMKNDIQQMQFIFWQKITQLRNTIHLC